MVIYYNYDSCLLLQDLVICLWCFIIINLIAKIWNYSDEFCLDTIMLIIYGISVSIGFFIEIFGFFYLTYDINLLIYDVYYDVYFYCMVVTINYVIALILKLLCLMLDIRFSLVRICWALEAYFRRNHGE